MYLLYIMKPSSTHRNKEQQHPKKNETRSSTRINKEQQHPKKNETRSSRMIGFVKSIFNRKTKPKHNQIVHLGQKKSKSPKIDDIGLDDIGLDDIEFEKIQPHIIQKKPTHKSMSNEIQRIQKKINDIAEEIEKNNTLIKNQEELITDKEGLINILEKVKKDHHHNNPEMINKFEISINVFKRDIFTSNNIIKTKNKEIEFYNEEKQELENSLNEAIKELEKNLKDGGKKRKWSKTKKMKLNRK